MQGSLLPLSIWQAGEETTGDRNSVQRCLRLARNTPALLSRCQLYRRLLSVHYYFCRQISGRFRKHPKKMKKKDLKVIGQYDSFFFFSSISLSATNPKKKQSSNFGTTAAFHGEKKEEKKNNRLSLSQIRGRQFPVVRNDASRKDFFFCCFFWRHLLGTRGDRWQEKR